LLYKFFSFFSFGYFVLYRTINRVVFKLLIFSNFMSVWHFQQVKGWDTKSCRCLESYKGKVKTHNYINRQNQSPTENCENRNDPDLVQAFLKKWWVESDFKAPNLPLSLRFKGSGCHCNSVYRTFIFHPIFIYELELRVVCQYIFPHLSRIQR
jgi:hypothetical protein